MNISGVQGGGGEYWITVCLTLYKVQQSIYLLDFQRKQGDQFTFMNFCALVSVRDNHHHFPLIVCAIDSYSWLSSNGIGGGGCTACLVYVYACVMLSANQPASQPAICCQTKAKVLSRLGIICIRCIFLFIFIISNPFACV